MGSALGMMAQKVSDMNLMMQFGMRAIQEFQTAVRLDPNNITGLMGRGMAMLMALPPFGNVDTALYNAMEKGIISDNYEEMMSLREKRYSQMFKANHGRIDVPKAVGFLRDHLDLSFWVARGAVPMVYGEFVGFDLRALLAGGKSEVKPERIRRDVYLDSEEFKTKLRDAE